MNQLQDGYVIDVPYPTFVHRQAMPVWLSTLTQLKGYQSPEIERPYRYLELGCAMGIHLHLTAAANPKGHFVGVDFNAQQLMVAEEGLAQTHINNLEFIQASFKDFLNQDLEPFDFIVTHGVWSWISQENQAVLLQVIAKFLKPRGVVYCSYMSHPGATELSSIQKLMFEMSRNLKGDSGSKAVQSLGLARKLAQSQTGLFANIPKLQNKLEQLAQDQPNYIAHDFLSEHWEPQHSADMIRAFGQHEIGFITGAGIAEYLDVISLPAEIRTTMQQLPLITLQETVRDISLNSLQRQDVYIKNKTKLNDDEQKAILHRIQLSLLPNAPVGQRLEHDPKISAIKDILGICEHILKLLAQSEYSIQSLFDQLNLKISIQQFKEIILLLIWAGYIHPSLKQNESQFLKATNQWMEQQGLAWRASSLHGSAIEMKF